MFSQLGFKNYNRFQGTYVSWKFVKTVWSLKVKGSFAVSVLTKGSLSNDLDFMFKINAFSLHR